MTFLFLHVFNCVVKSTLINSQLESVLVNHLSPLSFHSQMRTSVAVLILSLCAPCGHDRFDISFDFVVCLSNILAVGVLIIFSSIQMNSKAKVLSLGLTLGL